MSLIDTEVHNLAARHAREDAKRRKAEDAKREADIQRRQTQALEDVQNRLQFIMSESLKFGASERDPFWIRCVCASWHMRPRISSDAKYAKDKINTIVLEYFNKAGKLTSTKIIGLIKFSPLGGISGLVVRDFKQNVLFAYGELENRFEENDRWAPMLANFHLLGDAKPAIF